MQLCAPGESNNGVWETHFAELIHFVPSLVCFGAESATNDRSYRLLRVEILIYNYNKVLFKLLVI